MVLGCYSAAAQVPQTLSYQGLLTQANGSPVADGAHTIIFNFYTALTGGTGQPRTITGVNTFQGLFTTIIGNGAANSANAPLNNLIPALGSTQYYIGPQVDGGTELSPRVALTAVPYAFVASTLDAGATVSGSQLNSPITNAAVTLPAAQRHS